MAWPPNPNKPNESNQPKLEQTPMTAPRQGEEWRLLEKTLLASIEEQKASRRWGIFLSF